MLALSESCQSPARVQGARPQVERRFAYGLSLSRTAALPRVGQRAVGACFLEFVREQGRFFGVLFGGQQDQVIGVSWPQTSGLVDTAGKVNFNFTVPQGDNSQVLSPGIVVDEKNSALVILREGHDQRLVRSDATPVTPAR